MKEHNFNWKTAKTSLSKKSRICINCLIISKIILASVAELQCIPRGPKLYSRASVWNRMNDVDEQKETLEKTFLQPKMSIVNFFINNGNLETDDESEKSLHLLNEEKNHVDTSKQIVSDESPRNPNLRRFTVVKVPENNKNENLRVIDPNLEGESPQRRKRSIRFYDDLKTGEIEDFNQLCIHFSKNKVLSDITDSE